MNFLNKKIISFEEPCFGIDFSDLSFKVVQLGKEGVRDHIQSYALMDIPSDCFVDGRIVNKKKTAEFIRKAIERAVPKKISTRKVVCSLPESKIFLRIITIPHMEESEIGEAIKWEIEASIPLSIEQIYYDWKLIGEKDNKQNILTVAVSREVVDDILEVLELAKLEICALESESISTVRSLIENKKKGDDAFLIVDLGAKMTNFIVTQNGAPFFTSSIPFSSEGVTDAIAKALGISNADAEKLKVSEGLGRINEESAIFKHIKAYLESLVMEINKSIDFYQNISGEKSAKIKRVIICGGGSNLKGLLAYLAKRLGRDVSIGDPWINLNFSDSLPIINKERSTQFATAVGLAMYRSDQINLLPQSKKEELSRDRKFKSVLGWEIVISSMLLSFFAFLFAITNLLNLNLAAIPDTKNNQLNGAQYETIKYYEKKFSEINSKLTKIKAIDNDQLYWSSLFLKLSSVSMDSVEITDLSTKNLSLYLAGHAQTREDLLAFKNKLEQLGCFSQVNLPLSNLVSKDNVDFQMDLSMNEKCLKK